MSSSKLREELNNREFFWREVEQKINHHKEFLQNQKNQENFIFLEFEKLVFWGGHRIGSSKNGSTR